MSRHVPRRGLSRNRLVAAAVGVGMAACLAVLMTPSPAAAIPPGGCLPDVYNPQVDHGQTHQKVEPTQMVQNNNPTSIPVTFTSSVSATVSSTASKTTSGSGGINIGIVNTSVQVTYGYSVTHSATTQIGISVGPMTLPAGKIQFGDYGVFRQQTSGIYMHDFGCNGVYEQYSIVAYSVRGVGWKVWQS